MTIQCEPIIATKEHHIVTSDRGITGLFDNISISNGSEVWTPSHYRMIIARIVMDTDLIQTDFCDLHLQEGSGLSHSMFSVHLSVLDPSRE